MLEEKFTEQETFVKRIVEEVELAARSQSEEWRDKRRKEKHFRSVEEKARFVIDLLKSKEGFQSLCACIMHAEDTHGQETPKAFRAYVYSDEYAEYGVKVLILTESVKKGEK